MPSSIITFSPVQAIPSPCINICSIDPHEDRCEGCHRTLDEIARWTIMSPAERDRIMAALSAR